jgi:putative transposase
MGRKYKFHDNSKLYFVTFTVVEWVDVFTRDTYRDIIYDSLKFCQTNKGLEVYAYCFMTSHIHLIIGTETGVLSDIVRDFKSFTSRHIRIAIGQNEHESRRDWMLEIFSKAGDKNKRNIDFQFWQQHNHPIELSNPTMMTQRLNYIHNNPVEAGFVDKVEEWLHSSAADYYGTRKGRIELIMIG